MYQAENQRKGFPEKSTCHRRTSAIAACSTLFLALTTFYFLPSADLLAQTEIQNIKIHEPSKGMTLNFTTVANKISDVANSIIPFLIGVAIAFVIFGIFKYISAAGDTEKVAAGRTAIIWGVIAVFLMLAFWGLVIAIHNSIFG